MWEARMIKARRNQNPSLAIPISPVEGGDGVNGPWPQGLHTPPAESVPWVSRLKLAVEQQHTPRTKTQTPGTQRCPCSPQTPCKQNWEMRNSGLQKVLEVWIFKKNPAGTLSRPTLLPCAHGFAAPDLCQFSPLAMQCLVWVKDGRDGAEPQ